MVPAIMADPASRTGDRYATPTILDYVNRVHAAHDAGLARAFTVPDGIPQIQVSPSDGKLLELLLRLARAAKVVEVGTLIGYSAIRMARALPAGGHLWSIEYEPHHAEVTQWGPGSHVSLDFSAFHPDKTGGLLITSDAVAQFAKTSDILRITDPGKNRWRRLAPLPFGLHDASTFWSGHRLLVWGGSETTRGLAYDPRADRWSVLPGWLPLRGAGEALAWTGSSLIVANGAHAAAFTPAP